MGGDVVGGCGRVERLHFGCHFRVEKGVAALEAGRTSRLLLVFCVPSSFPSLELGGLICSRRRVFSQPLDLSVVGYQAVGARWIIGRMGLKQ